MSITTNSKNTTWLRALKNFQHIEAKEAEQELIFSGKKTAMLTISGANSFEARSHIYDYGGGHINLSDEMRIQGFTLTSKADMWSQVNGDVKKFRNKMWALCDLRKAGFSEHELLRVYKRRITNLHNYLRCAPPPAGDLYSQYFREKSFLF